MSHDKQKATHPTKELSAKEIRRRIQKATEVGRSQAQRNHFISDVERSIDKLPAGQERQELRAKLQEAREVIS